jgi:1-acyl-sn-glycerol-3-phosphate acyltransferase
MTGLAARRSGSLALLFIGIYGGCNWITAQRSDVGVLYFEWERLIPFWPLMIVPYLSIDAFFLAAPFLCRDREELGVFSRRISAAIFVAGLCFTLFPLRFGFERPAVDGWLGVLFEGFTSLDRPFNLFPSLHITLAVILAETYARHTRGLTRIAVLAWFALIGLSTILTFQHHVIDLAGGLLLAVIVFYAIRERDRSSYPATRNVRVGAYYFTGAAAAAALMVLLWPWGAILAWPALSLAIVSAGYFGLGSSVFRKADGRLPLSARLLLWPCLIGQRASRAYYRRYSRPYDAVVPGVWMGRVLDEAEATRAAAAGVAAVLDLTAEFDEPSPFTTVAYKNVQTLDLTAPSAEALDAAVQFVSEHTRRGIVYVHCKVGYSRSAAVVAAWLLASGHARTTNEALTLIRRARPQVIVRPEAIAAISQFETTLARPGVRPRQPSSSSAHVVVSATLATAARLICGRSRWLGSGPSTGQRIYFANHTSHLDFIAIWGSLPADVRATTHPVAGRDYWDRGLVRRLIARHVLHAVLVDRQQASTDRTATIASARRSVQCAVDALESGASLIIFPEGTRGDGEHVGPFKSGLYHLCARRPDVELVPVFLEKLNRILPKGETLPIPISASITFGQPLRLRAGEDKDQFLARARAALLMVNQPWTSPSTAISRAS